MRLVWDEDGNGGFRFNGPGADLLFVRVHPRADPTDSSADSSGGLRISPLSRLQARALARNLAENLLTYLSEHPDV